MLSNPYRRRRALRRLGSTAVVAVTLTSLGLWSAEASASPTETFDASCTAYVYGMTKNTTASWSGLHVKGIDLTWYDASANFVSNIHTTHVHGSTFTWPTPSGAATVHVTFYGGPGRYGGPVDTEIRTCGQ